MVNYKNGIIYRIYDNTNGDVYYGSTANVLRWRMGKHKSGAKIEKDKCKSKSIILNDDYVYSEVEKYPCNSKKELEIRERYYIENFTCINKYIPTRTIKEWRTDNKEHLKQYNETHNEIHKEQIKQYQSKYREDHKEERNMKHNCNCGGKYTLPSKARHIKSKKHQKYITDNAPICIECK